MLTDWLQTIALGCFALLTGCLLGFSFLDRRRIEELEDRLDRVEHYIRRLEEGSKAMLLARRRDKDKATTGPTMVHKDISS
jgi:hypothetical protein